MDCARMVLLLSVACGAVYRLTTAKLLGYTSG
jgi:hypothetical protein